MTDKEKIELIIQDKHLNNTEFCNEVCISPGTLSHIRSGRTEPTLNILRNVAQAFPDINPAWLFYGEGPMYKEVASPTSEDAATDETYLNSNSQEAAPDGQLPLFAFSASASPSTKGNGGSESGVAPSSTSGTVSRRTSATGSSASAPTGQTSAAGSLLSAADVQTVVAETLKQQQRPQRKVVEVRIFFDDGTFETFGTN